MRRLVILILAALLLLPSSASASEVSDTLVHRINALRVEHDRDRLRWDNRLVEGATEVAERLVHDFEHSTDVDETIGVDRWVVLGEAIGWGYNVEQVWDLILRSDAHRSMLLRPRWDRIGIGYVRAEVNGGIAHCEYEFLTRIDCISAGLEWFPAKGLFVAIWVYDEGR